MKEILKKYKYMIRKHLGSYSPFYNSQGTNSRTQVGRWDTHLKNSTADFKQKVVEQTGGKGQRARKMRRKVEKMVEVTQCKM